MSPGLSTLSPPPAGAWQALPTPPMLLGESPFWHPDENALYWVDIPGRALHRWRPASAAQIAGAGEHRQWPLDTEPGCIAPLPGGTLLLAGRDGLSRFDPATGARQPVAPPPFDPAAQRYNDGKADAQGRLWVSTICDARERPLAALYRHAGGETARVAGDITVGNGLGFAPDGRTLYWSDTASHRIFAFDLDGSDGTLSNRRLFAAFAPRDPARPEAYGGRPDGAAVDAEGGYWAAMFEGERLVRFAPDGTLLASWPLPARCPTMPCFAGPDLKTLVVTTARAKRPADELERLPLSGHVLALRVDVPGLPVHFAAPC